MKKLILTTLVLTLGVSCASKKDDRELEEREHENISREYQVVDASSNSRPGWIEDAEVWSRNHSKDTAKFRYFSYETEPKVSRKISCELAKVNAKADIAGEIATFIDKSIASSSAGNASIDENNPNVQALREYVESTLAEKVQALIHGAAIEKTYWEKRKYKKDLGAKKDFSAYICAVYVRIPKERLNRAIDEAANHVINQTDDPETKANVKKALQDVSDNFNKAKSGQI